MNIPDDTGHPYRLDKFVEYQHYAPAVDPPFYCEYARRNGLSHDNCILLAWYHSVTYSEVTAVFLYKRFLPWNRNQEYFEKFWVRNKQNLIFGSARKYAKNMDWFVPLMVQFIEKTKGKPYQFLLDLIRTAKTPRQRCELIEKELKTWKYMGRFSIDLIVEAIIALEAAGLIDLKIEQTPYTWTNCSNLTSGMLNIFYKDEAADEFDKDNKTTPEMEAWLDRRLVDVRTAVQKQYPGQQTDFISVVNKICSFRNLFKGQRYGGFHHDRQLGNIIHYQTVYPHWYNLWNEMYEIRLAVYEHNMLGELHGWEGIRPERKKLWIQKGLTGVEITG